MDGILKVEHLVKTFGTNEVLRDIDFSVDTGDVISIIGSSGSGKSTLLRCINLLEEATGGSIYFHGQDVLGGAIDEDQYRTKVGMVFQSFNLFSNMNVLDNCMIGQVKVLKRSKDAARTKALEYLSKVGMEQYIKAKQVYYSLIVIFRIFRQCTCFIIQYVISFFVFHYSIQSSADPVITGFAG